MRSQKSDYLDKCFLIFRPNDYPLFLKPVRVNRQTYCAITGDEIEVGDYAYRCYSNPIRLSPFGKERCHIAPALKKGNSIFPAGYLALRIPTTEKLVLKGKQVDAKRMGELSQAAVKLLKGE